MVKLSKAFKISGNSTSEDFGGGRWAPQLNSVSSFTQNNLTGQEKHPSRTIPAGAKGEKMRKMAVGATNPNALILKQTTIKSKGKRS
ncbi:MAG: hypothetical protein EOM23_11000 [Candidatus Moranbacteria bacterium]|nr:hypothetical protein [Candidatus Moranbacteria bacterium]